MKEITEVCNPNDTCSAINYETIAEYACQLPESRDAMIISDMLNRVAITYGQHTPELDTAIASIYRAHHLFQSEHTVTRIQKSGKPVDELPAEITEAPQTVIRGYGNGFVTRRLQEMGSMCIVPWHFSCMMAVCFDHGLLIDRTRITAFVRTLIALYIIPFTGKEVIRKMANSIGANMRRFPLHYLQWDDSLKDFRDKCVSLASCLDATAPYRGGKCKHL